MDSPMLPCVCGHRRAFDHPGGKRCIARVDTLDGRALCPCERFHERGE